MAVYSDIQIRRALEQGHIVCDPYEPANVRGSSIDLTLGENFYFCGRNRGAVFNPFDEESVRSYYGDPLKARVAGDPLMRLWYGSLELPGIPSDHPIIYMPARSRILAHTHEFVGIHPPGTTEMRARSSWGRIGISVCLCAGWGDPGYINRWTMEIHNLNDSAVPLPVGERIAQLIFHETGEVASSYDRGGKYQMGDTLKIIKAAWEPEQMLPRAYTDIRKHPKELVA